MEGTDRVSQEQVIEFDYDTHTYTVNGEDYPSLHRILEENGLIDTRYYKPAYAERGKAIHELTALLDRELITIDDIDEYKGYCEAWLQFKADFKPEFIDIEKPVANAIYKYACTPDRTCIINGKYAIVDIKSGSPEDWHGIQMGAQVMAVGLDDAILYGVYLKETGKYKPVPYQRSKYQNVWMAALILHQYKRS